MTKEATITVTTTTRTVRLPIEKVHDLLIDVYTSKWNVRPEDLSVDTEESQGMTVAFRVTHKSEEDSYDEREVD